MVYLHDSLGGEQKLIDFGKTREEQIHLMGLLDSLKKDTLETLEIYDTKKIKGVKVPIFEIILKDLRLFYIQNKEDICIIHISHKQKNKTERKDIHTAESWAIRYLK